MEAARRFKAYKREINCVNKEKCPRQKKIKTVEEKK